MGKKERNMEGAEHKALRQAIAQVPDYPKPGVLFYDISPLLSQPQVMRSAVSCLARAITPWQPDLLAAVDARGFLFAGALAQFLNIGVIMLRKEGKLPGKTVATSYTLEYGQASLEMKSGLLVPGQRVAIVDDVLATGGTMSAAARLIREDGGVVCGGACLLELLFLNGRSKLDIPFETILAYAS